MRSHRFRCHVISGWLCLVAAGPALAQTVDEPGLDPTGASAPGTEAQPPETTQPPALAPPIPAETPDQTLLREAAVSCRPGQGCALLPGLIRLLSSRTHGPEAARVLGASGDPLLAFGFQW